MENLFELNIKQTKEIEEVHLSKIARASLELDDNFVLTKDILRSDL